MRQKIVDEGLHSYPQSRLPSSPSSSRAPLRRLIVLITSLRVHTTLLLPIPSSLPPQRRLFFHSKIPVFFRSIFELNDSFFRFTMWSAESGIATMKPPASAASDAPRAGGGVFNVDRNNSLNQTLRKVTGWACFSFSFSWCARSSDFVHILRLDVVSATGISHFVMSDRAFTIRVWWHWRKFSVLLGWGLVTKRFDSTRRSHIIRGSFSRIERSKFLYKNITDWSVSELQISPLGCMDLVLRHLKFWDLMLWDTTIIVLEAVHCGVKTVSLITNCERLISMRVTKAGNKGRFVVNSA